MRARVTFPILLLLCTCVPAHTPAASPWVEFGFYQTWVVYGSIKGRIDHNGRAHVQARRLSDGRRVSFEKQLLPAEQGRLRQAITAHIAQMGASAKIRTQMEDANEISITVRDGETVRMTFHLAGPCRDESSAEQENELWDEIMRAVRSPGYDTRPHMIDCR